ncbi:GTP 3',8-cyclase MoaA [Aquifex aeolicus]|uniref:GTP 3',8-cyclase n=1 Tax=Aquifex aeolicus (strain VF5) TaxID=224324 RepID=MOAA_AQUAE|nr:GTP 3',8-cyclase MoaA [Aquifex aeolicus]O67929.1 RecName: Full=GTP 3',8-cyclase; AltName: Full=Molybdenum cofactor biosynthesis protein A [Aquifex aeolicus VF5]AAC07877.1 molybdenum cofactor biosynthesis protein A [Aquifex aeolicus VF5]
MLLDKLSRPLKVLRISLTDRCNLRCNFCMPPGKEYNFLPKRQLLTPEEIEEYVKIFAKLGVEKVRLTGGEPLLREDLEEIIQRISKVEGIKDIALTTNGVFLKERLKALKEAGLKRITVSVHSLNPEKNQKLVNRSVNLGEVFEVIIRAKELGFKVKVNSVIIKGFNDDEILDLARFFKNLGVTLRFIEYMDVGTVNDWDFSKVVSADEILNLMKKEFTFYPLPKRPEDTSMDFIYEDGNKFGIIASVTKPFCRGCNRIRLSADGKLYTCLFSDKGHDLRNAVDKENFIKEVWKDRKDRYSELRRQMKRERKVEMFKVGG